MKIPVVIIFLGIAVAVGAVFVFGQSDRQESGGREQGVAVESGSTTGEPKDASAESSQPSLKTTTGEAGEPKEEHEEIAKNSKELPEPLHPTWPEEIAPVYNPCANLQVPEHIKQAVEGLEGQKEKAEQQKQKVLAAHQLPREIFRGEANRKAIALTIDVGVGGSDGFEQILELGQHYGISFTFFLTGCWVLENPELTQQIAREGHSIANHTLTHLNLGTASNDQAKREIGETHRILQETLGWKPVLFRKPQYAGGDRIIELAKEFEMISVQGYPDFGDTTGWRSGTTSTDVEALVKRKTAPGAIWVFHNLSLADLAALEEIIRFHIIEGYEILAVEELIV